MERKVLTAEEVNALIPSLPDHGYGDSLYLCKAGPLAGQFAIDTISEPAIDEQAMTVRMRISTSQLDRVNHVVNQAGIKTDLYRDNPVVLYGHGLEISFPVAQSEDEQGNLTVTTEADGTYAKAYHQARNKLSSQIFDLVVQKFLRSSSIGITPLPNSVSKGYDSNGDEVLFIDEGWLNEWSYCTISINPGARVVTKSHEIIKDLHGLQCDAANRILLSNTLDGSSIHPAIMKSLQATLVRTTSSPGFEPREITQMKKLTADQVKAMKPKQLAKAMMEYKEYDSETQKMLGDTVESMPEEMEPTPGPIQETQVAKAEESPMEEMDEPMAEPDDSPLGAQVIRSIHDGVISLIETATKALGPVEAPEVKDGVTEILASLQENATALEGLFSSKYPDQGGLVAPEVETTDEVMKSFFAGSNRGRNQLQGLSARVDMISKSTKGGKLSAQQVKLLDQTARDLASLNQQAKSFKPAVVKAEVPDMDLKQLTVAFCGLKKQFLTLVETMNGTPVPMPKS